MKRKVWIINTGFGDGIMGGVIDSDEKKIPVKTGGYYYRINFTDGNIGTGVVLSKNIFLTKEDAIMELDRRESMARAALAETINSVEDLIKLMYSEMNCGEYTNYTAMDVVCEKAKELLGIDVE